MYGKLPYTIDILIFEGRKECPMTERAHADDFHSAKRERLEARVSSELKELIQRAAALEGRSLSDFVVESAQRAAEETIRERAVITLSVQDSHAFAKALFNPPSPSDRLRAMATRYWEEVEEQ